MKTRNGFVSNSSSSSFVIVGVKVDYDKLFDENKKDKYGDKSPIDEYDMDKRKIGKLDVVTDDGTYAYIGVGVTENSEYDGGGFNNTFIKLNESLKEEIKTTLESLGMWDEKKFGLYVGTVPS